MELGDKVTARPEFEGSRSEKITGTIVYIHPQHRFYTLEFPGSPPQNRHFRECFHFRHRRGEN